MPQRGSAGVVAGQRTIARDIPSKGLDLQWETIQGILRRFVEGLFEAEGAT